MCPRTPVNFLAITLLAAALCVACAINEAYHRVSDFFPSANWTSLFHSVVSANQTDLSLAERKAGMAMLSKSFASFWDTGH